MSGTTQSRPSNAASSNKKKPQFFMKSGGNTLQRDSLEEDIANDYELLNNDGGGSTY